MKSEGERLKFIWVGGNAICVSVRSNKERPRPEKRQKPKKAESAKVSKPTSAE